MNIFKKSIVISITLATLSLSTTILASAAYTNSNVYNTNEPSGYVMGTANYNDTFWVCGTQYARYKSNDTSVYVNNTSNSGVYMDIWGKKEGSTTKEHVGCPKNSNTHKYKDEDIWIPNNGPRMLNQYIYERGCKYACVRFYSNNGGSGYWSPDSVGSYPVINNF